jgi:hypothetical protein
VQALFCFFLTRKWKQLSTMLFMSAGPLKDKAVQVRLPEDVYVEINGLAQELGMSTAALARILLTEFMSAHKLHAGRMPWPPRFQYFCDDPVQSPSQVVGKETLPPRPALRAAVAEGQSRYSTTKDKAGSSKED